MRKEVCTYTQLCEYVPACEHSTITAYMFFLCLPRFYFDTFKGNLDQQAIIVNAIILENVKSQGT